MFGRTQKQRHVNKLILLAIISLFVFGAFAGWLWWENEGKYESNLFSFDTFPWSNKNFNSLKQAYPDIVAWVEVPNTNINLPVVQSPDDDYYYLSHAADGKQDVFGAAYIELCNKSNFSDPVTVIYGHNMLDDTMFATLHYFEDKDFFEKNDHFFIFMPGHIYKYKIISSYAGDNRHIINTNKGFQDKDVRKQYFDYVLNPKTHLGNIRSGITLDENAKLCQLSTCMSDLELSNQRYILTGVLIDEKETN